MSIDVNLKSKVEKYDEEKVERLYSTQLFKNIVEYTNSSKTLECLTVINGESKVDNCKIQRGVTLVLEPNETVNLNNSDFIVARPLIKEDV